MHITQAMHAYGPNGAIRHRSRSAALLQVSYQAVQTAVAQLSDSILMTTPGAELLDFLDSTALLYLLMSITVGATMHDPEFAFADPELAAVNGVGGGAWDGYRRKAWLVDEYPMVDLCFHGINYEHTKARRPSNQPTNPPTHQPTNPLTD